MEATVFGQDSHAGTPNRQHGKRRPSYIADLPHRPSITHAGATRTRLPRLGTAGPHRGHERPDRSGQQRSTPARHLPSSPAKPSSPPATAMMASPRLSVRSCGGCAARTGSSARSARAWGRPRLSSPGRPITGELLPADQRGEPSCPCAGWARAGDSAWARRPLSQRAVADQALLEQLRRIHARSRATSGAPAGCSWRSCWTRSPAGSIEVFYHRQRRHSTLDQSTPL